MTRRDTPHDEEALRREIVKLAMKRLKIWKKENPEGPIPFGKPGAMQHKCGYDMVLACLELEKLNGK